MSSGYRLVKESMTCPCNSVHERDKRPSMGPLLRLDSTGEVTSDRYQGGLKGDRSPARKCRVSDTLSDCMESVINSTSAYLGSCLKLGQPNTVNSLTASKRPLRELMSDIWRSQEVSASHKSPSNKNTCTVASNCGSIPSVNAKMPSNVNGRFECLKSQGHPSGWSSGIFGAFRCGLISHKMHHNSNSPTCCNNWRNQRCCSPRENSYPYISKQRHVPSQPDNLHEWGVDPNIKPYNARLLQKSRQMQNERVRNKCKDKTTSNSKVESVEVEKKTSVVESVHIPEKRAQCSSMIEQSKTSCNEHKANKKPEDIVRTADLKKNVEKSQESNSSNPACNTSSSETDWFEYEKQESSPEVTPESAIVSSSADINESVAAGNISKSLDSDKLTAAKLSVSKLETRRSLHESENELIASKEQPSTSPPLHSWFSMEEDVDSQSVRKENLPECSKSESDSAVHIDTEANNVPDQRQNDKSEYAQTFNVKVSHIDLNTDKNTKKCDSSNEHKDLSFQLYVRNCQGGKRSRPSARKRRRQKAKQEESTSRPQNSNTGKAHHPLSSSVSFLVGSPCHSFVVSFDEEDSLDWSDSDSGDDIDGCPQSNFDEDCLNMFSALNPVNFQVFCSFPSTPTTQTPNSALDAINLAWKINVSVEDSKTKKKSDKKVHFPSDKKLATVHQMVAWSYAYQAARKGPWEEIARDRGRFLRRITDSEKLLAPVLKSEHRRKMFRERFSDEGL